MKKWEELSMKERAAFIKVGVSNGITNLNDIKTYYNKFNDGGPVNTHSWRTKPSKELEEAFWKGDYNKMADIYNKQGKELTYVTPNSNLDEVVVTAINTNKEKQLKNDYNRILDLGITAAGFVPGIGEFADFADVMNQIRQKNYGDAALSTAGLLLPFIPSSGLRKVKNKLIEYIGDKTGYYYNIPIKENEAYRQVTSKAIRDAEKSGIIRANPDTYQHGKKMNYAGASFSKGKLYLPKNKELNHIIVGNTDNIEFTPRYGHMQYDDFNLKDSRNRERGYDRDEYTPVFNERINNSPISQFYYYSRGDKGLSKYFWKRNNFKLDDVVLDNMSDDVLDNLYIHSINTGDKINTKRLRDLHFIQKAPNTVVQKEGFPIETYHTVSNSYDPNFNIFDTNIEGKNTAIYTTDDWKMSSAYSSSYVNNEPEEIINYIINFKKERLQSIKDSKERKLALERFKRKYPTEEALRKEAELEARNIIKGYKTEPERMKKLYINLDNPLTIDAQGKYWSQLTPDMFPVEIQNVLPQKGTGLASKLSNTYSTRDVEYLYKLLGYNGAIVNNVKDYGPNTKQIINRMLTPATVYELDKSSQLKLSSPITFDDDGNIIKLSQRDNFKNPDIRYSSGGYLTKK